MTGNILAGMDMTFANGSRLEGRVGYGGIGEEDLDVFAGQIAFTIPF